LGCIFEDIKGRIITDPVTVTPTPFWVVTRNG
jgi:hypothetical protein